MSLLLYDIISYFACVYHIIFNYIILYIILYYIISFYIILYCIFYHMKNNYVEDMSKSMHDLSSLNSSSQALNLEVWQGFAKVLPNNQALEEYLSTWAVKTMPVAFRESAWWSANHHFFLVLKMIDSSKKLDQKWEDPHMWQVLTCSWCLACSFLSFFSRQMLRYWRFAVGFWRKEGRQRCKVRRCDMWNEMNNVTGRRGMG